MKILLLGFLGQYILLDLWPILDSTARIRYVDALCKFG